MFTHTYIPEGVCSREMTVVLDENETIVDVKIVGGCNGNLQGIAKLVTGRNAREVIDTVKGIDCNGKGTSCPDQLAKCLEEALLEM